MSPVASRRKYDIKSRMANKIPAAALRSLKSGAIHNVKMVFPDMQGRWMGKRATARYFLENAAGHGSHACAYLLTVDMEMDPVPGYELTSWSQGYQDFLMAPDFSTLREVPWQPGTAGVHWFGQPRAHVVA